MKITASFYAGSSVSDSVLLTNNNRCTVKTVECETSKVFVIGFHQLPQHGNSKIFTQLNAHRQTNQDDACHLFSDDGYLLAGGC